MDFDGRLSSAFRFSAFASAAADAHISASMGLLYHGLSRYAISRRAMRHTSGHFDRPRFQATIERRAPAYTSSLFSFRHASIVIPAAAATTPHRWAGR